jgi:FMN-dependent NADH-azoreductase
MISKQALEEFKEIWRQENPGQDIDDATAMDQAVALLTLMNTVYKPVKKEWLEKYKDEVDEENSEDKGGVK